LTSIAAQPDGMRLMADLATVNFDILANLNPTEDVRERITQQLAQGREPLALGEVTSFLGKNKSSIDELCTASPAMRGAIARLSSTLRSRPSQTGALSPTQQAQLAQMAHEVTLSRTVPPPPTPVAHTAPGVVPTPVAMAPPMSGVSAFCSPVFADTDSPSKRRQVVYDIGQKSDTALVINVFAKVLKTTFGDYDLALKKMSTSLRATFEACGGDRELFARRMNIPPAAQTEKTRDAREIVVSDEIGAVFRAYSATVKAIQHELTVCMGTDNLETFKTYMPTVVTPNATLEERMSVINVIIDLIASKEPDRRTRMQKILMPGDFVVGDDDGF